MKYNMIALLTIPDVPVYVYNYHLIRTVCAWFLFKVRGNRKEANCSIFLPVIDIDESYSSLVFKVQTKAPILPVITSGDVVALYLDSGTCVGIDDLDFNMTTFWHRALCKPALNKHILFSFQYSYRLHISCVCEKNGVDLVISYIYIYI